MPNMGSDIMSILHRGRGRAQQRTVVLALLLVAAAALSGPALAGSILFIGNSFTFAFGSPVRYYRPDTVADLNGSGQGGVPALFKSFAAQAGLSYDVFVETEPGVGIDWHLGHKLDVIGQRPWDAVVMHGFSTLDPKKPGDPAVLIASVRQMAEFLHTKNSAVEIRLMATWPRADQTYEPKGAWYGKSIEAMARDIREGYNLAAEAPGVKGIVPVGDAWVRAMHSGIADANPYDGIDAGKINLWTYDSYHASTYGYYLEALVLFGSVTGKDPRTLGAAECSGFELGLSAAQVGALQQVAFDQLAAEGAMSAAAKKPESPASIPSKCAAAR
jgi:hypothetical protein